MKFGLIFGISLLASFTSFSQLRYSVDTFRYRGEEVLLRRSATLQLDSFQKLGRIAFQLSLYAQKVQKQLDEAKAAVDENRVIYDFTLNRAQEIIDDAKKFYPAFDMDLYQEELHFYERYKKDFTE